MGHQLVAVPARFVPLDTFHWTEEAEVVFLTVEAAEPDLESVLRTAAPRLQTGGNGCVALSSGASSEIFQST